MSRKLRLAMVTPILPDSTGNGLAMRMGNFAEALAQLGHLHIILVPAAGPAHQSNAFIRALNAEVHILEASKRPSTHFDLLSRLRDPYQRLAAFKAYGLPSISAGVSAVAIAQLRAILNEIKPDIVHIGRSYLTPLAEALPDNIPATLDLDEDDFTSFSLQSEDARKRGDNVRADWLMQEGLACRSLISTWETHFSRIFIASAREASLVRKRHELQKVHVIENCITVPAQPFSAQRLNRLLFVGSLSYRPNEDGLIWFAERVLPRLRARIGGSCTLDVAGSGASARLLHKLPSGVRMHGFVASLAPLYRCATVAIAPLHTGGGTRIKLLEAGAYGLASVATSTACEGLTYPVGWIADTPSDFAECCLQGLSDAKERTARGRAARELVLRRHARKAVVSRIGASISAILT